MIRIRQVMRVALLSACLIVCAAGTAAAAEAETVAGAGVVSGAGSEAISGAGIGTMPGIHISLADGNERNLKLSEENFFSAFDGIVPGETRKQDLVITNEYGGTAEFYLWSERGIFAGPDELAKRLELKIVDNRGDRVRTCGPLSDIIRRCSLCTLGKGESVVISMYLTMPADVDGTYAGETLSTRWFVGADVNGPAGDFGDGSGDTGGSKIRPDGSGGKSVGSGYGRDGSFAGGPGVENNTELSGEPHVDGVAALSGRADVDGVSREMQDSASGDAGALTGVSGVDAGRSPYVIIGWKFEPDDATGQADYSDSGTVSGGGSSASLTVIIPWLVAGALAVLCGALIILLNRRKRGEDES
ncbi:MAG: hypothetical protein KBS51_01440 [Lachnospiraceae bacterium]|nr:hypothetical protein [Candidatus Darwinimomas equi]